MTYKTTITLEVTHRKPDPDLLDKITGRAWTLDGVTDVTGSVILELTGLVVVDVKQVGEEK